MVKISNMHQVADRLAIGAESPGRSHVNGTFQLEKGELVFVETKPGKKAVLPNAKTLEALFKIVRSDLNADPNNKIEAIRILGALKRQVEIESLKRPKMISTIYNFFKITPSEDKLCQQITNELLEIKALSIQDLRDLRNEADDIKNQCNVLRHKKINNETDLDKSFQEFDKLGKKLNRLEDLTEELESTIQEENQLDSSNGIVAFETREARRPIDSLLSYIQDIRAKLSSGRDKLSKESARRQAERLPGVAHQKIDEV